MDLLKRHLAPLTQEAWEEIDDRAVEVLKTQLSARRVVKVQGPKGLDYTVQPEGRLELLDNIDGEVKAGLYKVQPLIETRITFRLNRWEMDNLHRGAHDVDLEPLENAARRAAHFEENAIYNGFAQGQIPGLYASSEQQEMKLGSTTKEILEALSRGSLLLNDAFAAPPYYLVVGEEGWHRLNSSNQCYSLTKQVENLIGGKVLYSPAVQGAFLLPYNHDDLELTLGMDFSLGYEKHDEKEIQLFLAESFTFRVLDPALIVRYLV